MVQYSTKLSRAMNFAKLPRNVFCVFDFFEIIRFAIWYHNKLIFSELLFSIFVKLLQPLKILHCTAL